MGLLMDLSQGASVALGSVCPLTFPFFDALTKVADREGGAEFKNTIDGEGNQLCGDWVVGAAQPGGP